MYDDDLLVAPRSIEHFWEMVQANYEHARFVLTAPLESRDEALHFDARGTLASIPFRAVSEANDQRPYYRALGRKLLPRVARQIKQAELTPAFIHDWGQLMFCHGLLAGYMFDDSENLAQARSAAASGKARSRDKHLRWLAQVHDVLGAFAVKRDAADYMVEQWLVRLRRDQGRGATYPDGWFDVFLTDEGELRPSFTGKHLTSTRLKELRLQPNDDLPPVPKYPS